MAAEGGGLLREGRLRSLEVCVAVGWRLWLRSTVRVAMAMCVSTVRVKWLRSQLRAGGPPTPQDQISPHPRTPPQSQLLLKERPFFSRSSEALGHPEGECWAEETRPAAAPSVPKMPHAGRKQIAGWRLSPTKSTKSALVKSKIAGRRSVHEVQRW